MGGVKAEPGAPPPTGAITRRRAAEAYAANTTMTRRRSAQLAGAPATTAAVKAEPAAPSPAQGATPAKRGRAVKAEPAAPSPAQGATPAKRGRAVKAEPAAPAAAAPSSATRRGTRAGAAKAAAAAPAATAAAGGAPRRGAAKRGAPAAAAAAAAAAVAAAGASPPKRAKGKAAATAAAAAAAPPKRGKSKAAAAAAAAARGTRTRRGLGGTRAPATAAGPLGVVDPRAGVDGAICVDEDGTVYDVTLNLQDAATNSDKYYILQLIGAADGRFVVFSHYGRTGTAGQCLSVTFPVDGQEEDDGGDGDVEAGLAAALDAFGDKFTEKTGLPCDAASLAGASPPVPGKYRVVVMDHAARAAAAAASATPRWQYWVDDGVDGKPVGWYDYDAGGAAVTEGLFVEWGLNSWLTERVVASGAWTYLVNLADMSQTNLEHYAHTRRRIRRVPPGVVPDNSPPV